MPLRQGRDVAGLGALGAGAVVACLLGPAVTAANLGRPETWALLSLCLVSVFVAWLHGGGRRGTQVERTLWAVFIAAMPTVYLAAWALGDRQQGALVLELVGQLLFASIAWLGYRHAPVWLVVGFAAHGLAWDAWHRHAGFLSDGYAVACLVFDLGAALYLFSQLPRFERATPSARAA